VKKSLMSVLVACFVFGMAGTAMAFPLDMTGDYRFQFANWQDKIGNYDAADKNHNDTRSRVRLNFSAPVDQDVTFFGRLGVRTTSGLNSQDPNRDLLDQVGVKIANNGWDYTLGRQGVSLGQGTVIGTGNDVGYDSKFDGLVASGKLGVVNSKFIVGKSTTILNNQKDVTDPANIFFTAKKVWGVDFSTMAMDNLTVGATFASIDDAETGALNANNYIGINATYNPISNLSFNGEYVKSNADTNNKAYFLGGTYSWDKDNFTIQYNNVESNGVDQGISGIGAWQYPFNGENLLAGDKYSGFTYVYNHQLSKAATFSVCYMSLKSAKTVGNDNEYAAGVQWNF